MPKIMCGMSHRCKPIGMLMIVFMSQLDVPGTYPHTHTHTHMHTHVHPHACSDTHAHTHTHMQKDT